MNPETVLETAAFGAEPGCWPLPSAHTPQTLWWRAVAAGGQGRYAAALTDLTALARREPGGRLASLALSTRASFLRQLGRHRAARTFDGGALALAGDDPEAAGDALIGLAADALGVGRFAASETALRRAAALTHQGPRVAIRFAWVSAELAMVTGRGERSVAHAERAVEAAATFGSARHALKSEVVRAAALCSAGRVDASREVADAALREAERLGMIPLRWALACLLADIGSAGFSATDVAAIRDTSAATVRRRGGVWSVR